MSISYLPKLTERVRNMRYGLLNTVLGQDHAVHAFAEGRVQRGSNRRLGRKNASARAPYSFSRGLRASAKRFWPNRRRKR